MTIYQRMAEVFRLADVPGFLQAWRKTDEYPDLPELYAVYNLAQERPALSADDGAIFQRYDVTIWVYGSQDVTAAAAAIEDALGLEGFGVPRTSDGYAQIGGGHLYIKKMETTFVDFGDYGPSDRR